MRHQPKAGALLTGTEWEAASTHFEGVNVVADAGAAETLDVSAYTVHDLTLTTTCALTLSGASETQADSMTVMLRQDGTGSRTVTWPGSVEWPGSIAPVLATAANEVDVITLFTLDGGTVWYGFHANQRAGVAPFFLAPDYGLTPFDATGISVGTNNQAFYAPATLHGAATITGVMVHVRNQNGNISVGLYSEAGTRLATSGSVSCPAAGVSEVVFTSAYTAPPGRYYLALSASGTTATFTAISSGVASGQPPFNARTQATAHPVPATATFSDTGTRYFAIAGRISGGYP